ncbi:hypothetical protein KUTeg_014435 [Tegillarca granosa]|uniref:Uncharacterized protein n=1 Tax=Tegillarca granosa TaxID=220873 RepID=A0ABQ9EWJ2_TEGGR|nr:hypothetical protein KUTeg_014435 [Tegillarca granosa]
MCDLYEEADDYECPFQEFTPKALAEIENRIKEQQAEANEQKQTEEGEEEEPPHHEEEKKPNPKWEIGKKIPLSFKDDFDSKLVGKPLVDLDPYYENDLTFMVIGKDMSVSRFSATKALFLLTPFNPLRRLAVYILVHPYPL